MREMEEGKFGYTGIVGSWVPCAFESLERSEEEVRVRVDVDSGEIEVLGRSRRKRGVQHDL